MAPSTQHPTHFWSFLWIRNIGNPESLRKSIPPNTSTLTALRTPLLSLKHVGAWEQCIPGLFYCMMLTGKQFRPGQQQPWAELDTPRNNRSLLELVSMNSGLMGSIQGTHCWQWLQLTHLNFCCNGRAGWQQRLWPDSRQGWDQLGSPPESSSHGFCLAENPILSLVWKENYSWIIFIRETVTSPML